LESGDPLHRAVAHRGVAFRAEGELAQGAAGLFAPVHPGEDTGPSGEVVQGWETFAFQESGELEAIVQAEVRCDLLRRTDGAPTEEHRFDDRARPERQIGARGVNGPHDGIQIHCHRNKRVTVQF